jgi:hypothetical protein
LVVHGRRGPHATREGVLVQVVTSGDDHHDIAVVEGLATTALGQRDVEGGRGSTAALDDLVERDLDGRRKADIDERQGVIFGRQHDVLRHSAAVA